MVYKEKEKQKLVENFISNKTIAQRDAVEIIVVFLANSAIRYGYTMAYFCLT